MQLFNLYQQNNPWFIRVPHSDHGIPPGCEQTSVECIVLHGIYTGSVFWLRLSTHEKGKLDLFPRIHCDMLNYVRSMVITLKPYFTSLPISSVQLARDSSNLASPSSIQNSFDDVRNI